MAEYWSIEAHDIYTHLNDQHHFSLSNVNEAKNYFIAVTRKRELINKRLRKCIVSFNYFDKLLTALSAKSDSISIASFETDIGAPVGKTSATFSLAFSMPIGIVRKLLKTTLNKQKKHKKLLR